MHPKLAVKLLGKLLPFVLVEVVPRRTTAPVKEVDCAPVLERVGAVLLFRFARERDTLLNEGAEGSDSLS